MWQKNVVDACLGAKHLVVQLRLQRTSALQTDVPTVFGTTRWIVPRSDYAVAPSGWGVPHFAGYRSPDCSWDSAITELFGGSLGSPRLSVELLVGPIEVDLDAEQHDAVVGDELADDHRRCDEGAAGDQDPLVGTVGVGDGQCVEVLSELIDDRRKVDDDEVGTRRLSVGPSVAAELAVEVVENAWSTRTVRRLVTGQVSWRLGSLRCALRSCAESVREVPAKPC